MTPRGSLREGLVPEERASGLLQHKRPRRLISGEVGRGREGRRILQQAVQGWRQRQGQERAGVGGLAEIGDGLPRLRVTERGSVHGVLSPVA